MKCPNCGFEIPAECRNEWDYACPTCHEEFRMDLRAPPGRRLRRSGLNQHRPEAHGREFPIAVPMDTENFREWFYRLTTGA